MSCLMLLILGSIGADLPPIPWDDVPKEVASLKARVEKLEQKFDPKIKSNRDVPIFKTADWCANCPAIEQTMRAANYDFKKVDPLPGESIPRVEWNGRYVEGNNPLEVLKLLGGDPTAGQPLTVMATPVSYHTPIQSSGPNWTWPGDLRTHLLSHGHSPEELAGLSHSEMVALHNNDHNGMRSMSSWAQSSGRILSGPRIRLFGGNRRLFRGGGCPGGSCPN